MSFDIAKYPTLALVDSTQELRLLPKESLPKLCDELRRYLLDSVSRSSGHFASGLGTVELTVALHYVYNTPFDQLIWDVGHQAYPHKILTGRRDKIGTIRQKGGLHPFPWRGESEYDVLSVGHSSTSISAGIGIAVAAEKEGKNRRTVFRQAVDQLVFRIPHALDRAERVQMLRPDGCNQPHLRVHQLHQFADVAHMARARGDRLGYAPRIYKFCNGYEFHFAFASPTLSAGCRDVFHHRQVIVPYAQNTPPSFRSLPLIPLLFIPHAFYEAIARYQRLVAV